MKTASALLRTLGAELVPFLSPLDRRLALPEALHGLYLGGGYPELYAAQLSENRLHARTASAPPLQAGCPASPSAAGLCT